MKYFWLMLWLFFVIVAGIFGGWQSAGMVVLAVCFCAGVWTIIAKGVDSALRPQEPRSGPPTFYPTRYMPWDERDARSDPTRPDDEHPVIVLKDYEYRRHKK